MFYLDADSPRPDSETMVPAQTSLIAMLLCIALWASCESRPRANPSLSVKDQLDTDRQDGLPIKKCYDSSNIYFERYYAKTNDRPPNCTAGARERFASSGYLG